MVLRSIFPAAYAALDNEPPNSRLAVRYVLRYTYILGLRTPPQRFFIIYCIWSFALNTMSTFYSPIAFVLGSTNMNELTLGEFLNSLQQVVSVSACSLKLLVLWALVKRLDCAAEILDKLDEDLKERHERRQIHLTVAKCNRIALYYASFYMIHVTLTFLSAMAKGVPAYQTYYPFLDWHEGIWQFWLQSWLEQFAIMGSGFQNATSDSYPIVFILPLRTHLAIFADRLRKLGRDTSRSYEQHYEDLVACIEHHKHILRYSDALRPVISGTIFIQFITVGLEIGLALINISLNEDLGTTFVTISFIVAVLVESTPFCIICTYLVDDCHMLTQALFESNWIDAKPRYKKTWLFFFQKLQKPIQFKAMNLFTISVATSVTITKFALTVYTVMQQMNVAEKFSEHQSVDN